MGVEQLLQQLNNVNVKKAITSGSFSFGLAGQEASAFIKLVVNQSKVLPLVQVDEMPDVTFKIDPLDLSGRVFRPAVSGIDPGDTVGILTAGQSTMIAQEVVAIVFMGDDTIEDNIEKEAFVDKLMGMIKDATANEIEYAAMHGRKWGGTATPRHMRSLNDGWVTKLLAAGHVIDAATMSTRYIDLTVGNNKWTKLIKTMPDKWKQDPNQVIFTSSGIQQDFADTQIGVQQLGGNAVAGQFATTYRGIPIVAAPMMQTNGIVTQNYGSGATTLSVDALADSAAASSSALGLPTSLTVGSITNFSNGDQIIVGVGTAEAEVATISGSPSGSAITLAAPLAFDHAATSQVKNVTALTNDGNFAMLINPKRLHLGIHRHIKIASLYNPRKRGTDWVVSFRYDTAVDVFDAGVIMKNLASR